MQSKTQLSVPHVALSRQWLRAHPKFRYSPLTRINWVEKELSWDGGGKRSPRQVIVRLLARNGEETDSLRLAEYVRDRVSFLLEHPKEIEPGRKLTYEMLALIKPHTLDVMQLVIDANRIIKSREVQRKIRQWTSNETWVVSEKRFEAPRMVPYTNVTTSPLMGRTGKSAEYHAAFAEKRKLLKHPAFKRVLAAIAKKKTKKKKKPVQLTMFD